MRRILLSAITLLFVYPAFAATIKWDGGGGDNQWSTAANWIGDAVPMSTDDVILDNSVMAGNYIVYLPDGAVAITVASLIIIPAEAANITLILPATNISSPAFSATGDGDAVVLNSGAIFINESGASGGTTVSVGSSGYFRINNGGKYIHRTVRTHASLVDRLSAAAGTEKGVFEFDIPAPTGSATISLSGRTYGILILSAVAKGGPMTYSGNGTNPLIINGDLIINSNTTFSIGLSANMIVRGNYQQASASVFNLQNSINNNLVRIAGNINSSGTITKIGSGTPVLELNGTTNQNVSISGIITNNANLRINNPAGITLSAPLSLSYNLDLQNGKIKTDAINILTLIDNATITGGSENSFIEGPMKKIGDDNFTFPIGKGSIYAPIGFTATGMMSTDAFRAEYFRLNPQTEFGADYESPIEHVSYVEYWQLEKVTGSLSPTNVTLSVTEYSFAKHINTLYVASNSGSLQWQNEGQQSMITGASAPPYITGSVTSSAVSQFGIFTLATNETEVENPLPLNIIQFKVARLNSAESKIDWKLTGYNSRQVQFEIERSIEGSGFATIKTIHANSFNTSYSVIDNNANEKNIRYRLKIINEDDSVSYSQIILLPDKIKLWEMSVYPNPVTGNAYIGIGSLYGGNVNIRIYDAGGRTVRQWQQSLTEGTNIIPVQMNTLKNGIYFLSASGNGIKTCTAGILKQ